MAHSKEDQFLRIETRLWRNLSEIARLENETDQIRNELDDLEAAGLDRAYIRRCFAEGVDGD